MSCGYTEPFQPEKLRRVCERILENCIVDKYRYHALSALIYTAEAESDEVEAEKLIACFPEETSSLQRELREMHYYRMGKTEQYVTQVQNNLQFYLGEAFGLII